MPPTLKGTTYKNLISVNQSNNNSKNISITSAQTNIDEFTLRHPEYKSQIDALSEPSLSGDLNLWMFAFGKSWGVFIPIRERHRLLSVGGGFGISYTEGQYAVNLCDPYIIEGEITKYGLLLGQEVSKGICSNKSEIYAGRLNHFGFSLDARLGLYSYIGESFGFNIFRISNVIPIPVLAGVDNEKPLRTEIDSGYFEGVSIVYAFQILISKNKINVISHQMII